MEKAFEFLSGHKDVAFATVDQGRPKIRVFQIMKQEGHTLYFATARHKEVYRQLMENPHVELLALEAILRRCPSTSYRNGSDSCDSVPLRYVFFSMSIPQMYQRVLSAGGQSTVSSAILKGRHANTPQVLDNETNITLPYAFIPVSK